jgi:hypothetical protein
LLVKVQVIGPVKLPVKIALCGTPFPFPVTSNVEPELENVPPAAILPVVRTPVEKLTEPRECPGAALTPLKLVSCDPIEVMPAFEIAILPNWFVRTIPSAKAVSGKASARKIRNNVAFMFTSPLGLE